MEEVAYQHQLPVAPLQMPGEDALKLEHMLCLKIGADPEWPSAMAIGFVQYGCGQQYYKIPVCSVPDSNVIVEVLNWLEAFGTQIDGKTVHSIKTSYGVVPFDH